ncbi:MAG: YjdF family protein [Syntrophomonas sp.]
MEDDRVKVRLRVYFEEPFWVGLFERYYQGRITACKVVFGPEPRSWEIARFVDSRYQHLVFSPPVEGVFSFEAGRINPKRRQRSISRQMKQVGSTCSQQALQLQREACSKDRRARRSQQRAEQAQQKYLLRQVKKKEKKKGH